MAFEVNEIGLTLEPAADLSGAQYKFITQNAGTTGALGKAAVASWGQEILGVQNNVPTAVTGIQGYQIPSSIVTAGITRLRVDAAYVTGTYYGAATGVNAGIGTSDSTKASARAVGLEMSTAADDVISVRLIN
jgi:hypothetical protein